MRERLSWQVLSFQENEKLEQYGSYQLIDAEGLYLVPGAIDDQVHFRDPGLTHKGDIATESRAAVAGGVTSFMDMPNTVPNTLTQELLQDKYDIAAEKSMANYSFYMGMSNDNIDEVLKTDPKNVCGIKAFMGSSTGNMFVAKRRVTKHHLLRQNSHQNMEHNFIYYISRQQKKYNFSIIIYH